MGKPLPTYNLESMSWEDKRAAAIRMVTNGHSFTDIVNVFGYGKAQAKKIVSTVNQSNITIYKAPDLYVEDATDEIHYGKKIVNPKYLPEDLKGEEKNIYNKMVRSDAKKQFRND